MTRFITEPVRDIRTGEITGTITVEVQTDAEAAASTAKIAQEEINEQTIRQRLEQAIDANMAFLNSPSRGLIDLATQVEALTKHQNATIRQLLRRFDSV